MVGSAICGDFIESLLKRCGSIKDSGVLFAGHGGILDRTDSFVLGLPLTYYFVTYLNYEVEIRLSENWIGMY